MYNFTPFASVRWFYNDLKDRFNAWLDAKVERAADRELDDLPDTPEMQAYYLAQDLGFTAEDAMAIASNPDERKLFL